MKIGRSDRSTRLTENRTGAWASSSQDYLHLAEMLYENSAKYATSVDGNCSPYALAGVPVLFSAIRALLIEANSGMFGQCSNSKLLKELGNSANEIPILKKNYDLPASLVSRLEILYETRNEIIHPSHMPTGTSHGTPSYLIELRNQAILQSSGDDNCDYSWIAQLESHMLFREVYSNVEQVAKIVLKKHHSTESYLEEHLLTYKRYREIDLNYSFQ